MTTLEIIQRETRLPVTEDTLVSDLGLDSLEFTELLMKLSEKTGIEVPDDKVPGMETVRDMAKAFA